MTRQLENALEIVGLELQNTFPRDLVSLIPFQLPLTFISIEELTTRKLEDWLVSRRIAYRHQGSHRRLHGALAARAGHGVVFLDGTDEVAEQRFTAAHETAHFIEDHLRPRLRAIKALGETIRPVLDGKRPPTPEESVSAVLNRVPLGVQVHLMARTSAGVSSAWDVEESEQRADRLALEIVAPAIVARRLLRGLGSANRKTDAIEPVRALADYFGLPISAARAYADSLVDTHRSRPKLSEILLGGRQ